MAVSGKKALVSNIIWPDSDVDLCCVPCNVDDQNVKARGYCEDCQDYLCSACFTSHRKNKASKHHKLHERPDADELTILDDKCQLHNNEIIKFYCPTHKELGCHDCMVLKHKPCEVDYISDKSRGIAKNAEYNETLMKLEEKIKKVEDLEVEILERSSEANAYFTQSLKDIDDFESQMIYRIKAMKMKVVSNAVAVNESMKKVVMTSNENCSTNVAEMKQLQLYLRENKDSRDERELYIAIKRAESKMEDLNVHEERQKIRRKTVRREFRRNAELEIALGKYDSLGYMHSEPYYVTRLGQLVFKLQK